MERYKKVKKVRINLLDGPRVLPFGAFVKNGQVTPGFTWQNQRTVPPERIVGMLNSNFGNCLLATTYDGGVYYATRAGATKLARIYSDGGSSGFLLDVRDDGGKKAIAFSGSYYTSQSGGTRRHGEYPNPLCCGVIKNGRLFGADLSDRYVLRWSGKNGWDDGTAGITDAGSFAFGGNWGYIRDIFDVGGELIVMFETGLGRMSVGGNPENFKVVEVQSLPMFSRYTAAVYDGCIYFVNECGFMRYKDGKVTKVEGLISDDISAATSAFIWHGQYYFVCGTSRSLGRKVIYVYDIFCDKYQMVDVPAYFVYYDMNSVIAYTESTVYRLNTGKNWMYSVEAENIDFGAEGRKLVTCIEADCDEDVSVSISNGVYTRTLYGITKKIRLNMRGDTFKVTFSGANGSVRSAYLTAEVPA